MFELDDPKVEAFLEEWFAGGEHQFGRYRNQIYTSLEGYKKFIRECWLLKVPAFHSVQPVLCMEKLFYEFDTKEDFEYSHDAPELDGVWVQVLILAKKISGLGAEPLIAYSGRRGYHVWAYVGEWSFVPEFERQARKLYKKLLFGAMGDGDAYPDFDAVPTHINALARIPFSYHQKTGKQVVPLTLGREPYVPDLSEFKEKMIPQDYVKAFWNEVMNFDAPPRKSNIRIGDWNIRECIDKALRKGPSHNSRLAFLLDAIYAGMSDEEMHAILAEVSSKYDHHISQYQIDYGREGVKSRGLRPTSCETLKEWGICNDYCKADRKVKLPWGAKNDKNS